MTTCPCPLGGCSSPPALGAGAGRRISSGSKALKGRFFCSHAAKAGTSCWVLGSDVFVSGSITWLLQGQDRGCLSMGPGRGVGSLAFRVGTGLVSSAIVGRRVTHTNSARSWRTLHVPPESSLVTPHHGETLPKCQKGRAAQMQNAKPGLEMYPQQ